MNDVFSRIFQLLARKIPAHLEECRPRTPTGRQRVLDEVQHLASGFALLKAVDAGPAMALLEEACRRRFGDCAPPASATAATATATATAAAATATATAAASTAAATATAAAATAAATAVAATTPDHAAAATAPEPVPVPVAGSGSEDGGSSSSSSAGGETASGAEGTEGTEGTKAEVVQRNVEGAEEQRTE